MTEQPLPLEKEIGGIFANFPAFPDNVKELLVQIAPWGALIIAVLGGLSVLSLIGLGSLLTATSVGVDAYGSTWQMWISILALGLMAILAVLAFSPLRNRQRKGWNYLYYIELVSIVSSIVTLSFFSAIIGFLIGFWVLFQTREKYS